MRAPVPDLAARAVTGATLDVRVVPRAGRDEARLLEDGTLQLRVTAAPEDGRATDAARRLLAQALGVAPSRLTLLRGAASRAKTFRLD